MYRFSRSVEFVAEQIRVMLLTYSVYVFPAFIAALYIDKDLEYVHTFMNVCFFPRLKVSLGTVSRVYTEQTWVWLHLDHSKGGPSRFQNFDEWPLCFHTHIFLNTYTVTLVLWILRYKL